MGCSPARRGGRPTRSARHRRPPPERELLGAESCDRAAKNLSPPCRSRRILFVVSVDPPKNSRHTRNPPTRVMVMVKATANSEAGQMPSTELMEAMGRYNE